MSWLLPERRLRRSPDRAVALRYQLEACRDRARLEALVVTDDDGMIIAQAGNAGVCEELGAYAPLHRRAPLGMRLPPLLRGGQVAVRPVGVDGQALFLAALGGGVARDAVLDHSRTSVKRILAANCARTARSPSARRRDRSTVRAVDLREARELLGVDAEDDAKAVRRAYLRRLKQHKPESDPEGFQRVREAFEVAKSCVGFRLGGRPGAPAACGEAPPAPRDETMAATGLAAGSGLPTGEPTPPIDAGASEPEAPAGTALANARQPPPPPLAPLDELRRSMDRIDAPALRVSLARDAAEAYSDRVDAHWFLFDLLDAEGDEDGLLAAARAAAEQGHGALLLELDHMGVDLAPTDRARVAELLGGESPLTAVPFVAASDPARAAAYFHEAFDRAEAEHHSVEHYQTFEALFALFGSAPLATGQRAYARYRAYLDETGTERELVGDRALRLLTLRELAGLPDAFPARMLGPLARAARSLGGDRDALRALHVAALGDRDEATRAGRLLRAHAKQLSAAFGKIFFRPSVEALGGDESEYGPPSEDLQDFERKLKTGSGSSGPGTWGYFFIILALFNCARACGRSFESRSSRSPEVERILEMQERIGGLGLRGTGLPSAQVRGTLCADPAASDPAAVLSTRDGGPVPLEDIMQPAIACQRARAVAEALDRVDCDGAREAIERLWLSVEGTPREPEPELWTKLRGEVDDLCAPLPELPDG